MSGITKILTRTPSELGSIKTNKSPIVEENKQLPAEQWNTAADAIIEIQTVIGEAANPAAGTITEVLSDHEERIDELEQNGGGGGGTPGHVICNVTEDDPPIEPVPQRKNLVFFSDTSDVVVQDFEDLDTTVVNFLGGATGLRTIYEQSSEDPNENTYAQASVTASYLDGEAHTSFSVQLFDHNSDSSVIYFDRNPNGERFELRLGYQPGDLMFEVNDHTSYGDKEFRLRNAPTLIETPMKPMHAATKGYVDARLPTLEWWDPVWTPVINVDSVSNVECQYTRTYRAAGGSLVTLEGTIEVTQGAAGQCAVQVDLPTARVGSGLLVGPAVAREVTPPGHVVAVASVDNGKLLLRFNAEGADPYLVGFRASYRAA